MARRRLREPCTTKAARRSPGRSGLFADSPTSGIPCSSRCRDLLARHSQWRPAESVFIASCRLGRVPVAGEFVPCTECWLRRRSARSEGELQPTTGLRAAIYHQRIARRPAYPPAPLRVSRVRRLGGAARLGAEGSCESGPPARRRGRRTSQRIAHGYLPKRGPPGSATAAHPQAAAGLARLTQFGRDHLEVERPPGRRDTHHSRRRALCAYQLSAVPVPHARQGRTLSGRRGPRLPRDGPQLRSPGAAGVAGRHRVPRRERPPAHRRAARIGSPAASLERPPPGVRREHRWPVPCRDTRLVSSCRWTYGQRPLRYFSYAPRGSAPSKRSASTACESATSCSGPGRSTSTPAIATSSSSASARRGASSSRSCANTAARRRATSTRAGWRATC
jgi:hypothetical protein